MTVIHVPAVAVEASQTGLLTRLAMQFALTYSCVARCLCLTLGGVVLFGYSNGVLAWSEPVHDTIGIVAIGRLQDDTRSKLETIVGELDEVAIGKACNWPDVIRDEDAWEWSKPQHYINIPRENFSYLASRDCPEQICATQAVKRYARELLDSENSQEQSWQAFAWLCHLVGDLHQPMHAGFADDRGGNSFDVRVRDETMNLHYFWDHELINHNTGSVNELTRLLESTPVPEMPDNWLPQQVDEWTNESHAVAMEKAYPPSTKVDEAWEKEAWQIALERINLAASRLALVIETLLGNSD